MNTVKAITETPLRIYRIYDGQGELCGYVLNAQDYEEDNDATPEEMTAIDPAIDTVGRIEVHVFTSKAEAHAFHEGPIAAGDETYAYNIEATALGWAVLRECTESPEEGEPDIAVMTYDLPR